MKVNQDLKDIFEVVARLLEVIAVFAGVYYTIVQIKDVRNMQSAQLMLEFDKDLNGDSSNTSSKIIEAIENGDPIFKPKGKFSENDVDRYLSSYELINNAYQSNLINDTMLYNAFSYDTVETYKNKEISDYIKRIRKNDDKNLFVGFEKLSKSLILAN